MVIFLKLHILKKDLIFFIISVNKALDKNKSSEIYDKQRIQLKQDNNYEMSIVKV